MQGRYLATPLVFIFCLFSCLQATAQRTGLTVRIVNAADKPIPFATVSLRDAADSSRSYKSTADSSGVAALALNSPSRYRLVVTASGYTTVEKAIMVNEENNRVTIQLKPNEIILSGVVVTSSRPLMRQEDDKTIVDPENLVASSTSGYEVIEKTPGIFMDQDGNIYLNSATPATVLINGREMKMSAADIATLLKSLPPNAIASIEIMRTPSAKYDATGSGGVVNVVLKKGVRLGTTGSAHMGWQQGEYGNKFAGITVNNNDGRLTSTINVNYNRRVNFEQIRTDRLLAPDTLLKQDAGTLYPSNIYYAGLGLGYKLNPKTDVNYDLRISLNRFENHTDNSNNIGKISNGQDILNSDADIENRGSALNISQGLQFRNRVDSAGSEWSGDIAYTYSRNNTDQQYFTTYLPQLAPPSEGSGNALNNRHLAVAQSDLTKHFAGRWKVEGGVKSSLLWFNSNTAYNNIVNGTSTKDETRTNRFRYTEVVNAFYLQGSKTIKNIIIKFGARAENTNMTGRQQLPDDTTFSIRRTDLFPYVYLSKKVMVIAGYELRAYLVYRRTLSRPVYEQLNPFPRYVDQYLSEKGNPALRPQFTSTYEANISVDEKPLLAVGYNNTSDIFTNVIYESDTSSQAYRTYDNLGKNKEFYLRGLGAIPPGKAYFFVVGAQFNRNFYNGEYDGEPLSLTKNTWLFFTYHTLRLGKRSQLTVNGFYRTRGQQQLYELSSFGMLNASINRQFMKQRLIVTLSANDIFFTNNNRFTLKQGTVSAEGLRKGDTRRVGINIRYNFGSRKKEEGINFFNMESPDKVN